jgi:tetratricopeptide (TPR) repeat protein/transcriptional regulator with XRE-family HTH domain
VAGQPEGFGKLVHDYRVAAGLSQEELAERSGLSVRAISDIERGRTARPHRNSVSVLAGVLGLAEADLLLFASAAGQEDGAVAARTGRLAPPAAGLARPMTPRQLPGRAAPFVGRAAELAALDGVLRHSSTAPGTVVISAIAGTAGIGKTTLALHWAHLAAGNFPDGQLYANLRGFDPSGPPVTPAAAIRVFLDVLGVAQEQVPAGAEAQAGLYRSLLAGRRMLIVLDNASDANQVRPLLPAGPGCLVLVTSRNLLTDLVAVDGAYLLALDLLAEAEALDLLRVRLGPARVIAEPEAAEQLTGLCARLPLALCIAAARAAAHPHFTLASLAAELQDTARRLEVLAAGEGTSSLRAVFSWSYQQLSAPNARMFRLLGLHPGPDITAAAAASLAGMTAAEARRALQELTRANLLAEDTPGRFAFHDLLRAYASELTGAEDSPGDGEAATLRILDHYLHTALRAARAMDLHTRHVVTGPPGPGVLPEDITGYDQAVAWFDAEHRVLLAAVGRAAQAGLDTHAWQLPATLAPFLGMHGHWDSYLTMQRTALAAALRLGDLAALATTRRFLGKAHTLLGSYDDASAQLREALTLFGQLGDAPSQARVHLELGELADREGRYPDVLDHCQQALSLFQAAGDRRGQAVLLNNMGWTHAQIGDYGQALACCEQALTMFTELGHEYNRAHALDSLGFIHQRIGQYDDAVACYQQALTLTGELGDRHNHAKTLANLGDAHHAAGRPQAARQAWQQALAILDDLHDPSAGDLREKMS